MSAEMIDILGNLGPFHWWALAALLIGVEMVMPTQYMLWPGLSAIVTGLALLLFPGMPIAGQILFFALLSGVLVLTAHYWPKNAAEDDGRVRLNQRTEGYIGRQAIVAEDFKGARGVVLVDDSRWQAEAIDGRPLPSRTVVEIIGSDGTLLKVKPVG
jgi:inner membrane protein